MTRDGIELFVRVFDNRTETTFPVNALTVVASRGDGDRIVLGCRDESIEIVDLAQYLDRRVGLLQLLGVKPYLGSVQWLHNGVGHTERLVYRGIGCGSIELVDSGVLFSATTFGGLVFASGDLIMRQTFSGEFKDLGVRTPKEALVIVAASFFELPSVRVGILPLAAWSISVRVPTYDEMKSAACFSDLFSLRARLGRKRRRYEKAK